MVDRNYVLPFKGPGERFTYKERDFVRYTRGQPIGALSSWALLALAHHFIVFVAHHRSICETPLGYNTPNIADGPQDYLVLGDDITIGSQPIAQAYLTVCETLGIPVNQKKSYISTNSLVNFASQIFLGSENISPVSFREELSVKNFSGRLEMVRSMVNR